MGLGWVGGVVWGHTVIAHGGQQPGQGPRLCSLRQKTLEGMTDRQTDRHTYTHDQSII